MKPYLVDVPVRVQVWIRPECQKAQWEVIKKARPSTLFLISDGGRNDEEWQAIHENRKMIDEGIDWDCKVYRLYEEKNNGLYTMGKKVAQLIWNTVDRCIFLEDDQIPSVSYFRFCAEMLEKYKDDERISCVTGVNYCGISEEVNTDYFFSNVYAVWGTAKWKRSNDMYGDFMYGEDSYVMDRLLENTKQYPYLRKRIIGYVNGEKVDGHVPGGEYYTELSMYLQNQLIIIPKVNMICNIGDTANSAHASTKKIMIKGVRRLFNMKTYEMEFPIKHAKYVVPDYKYKKISDRIFARKHPHIRLYRRIEAFFRVLIYGDKKMFRKKIHRLINRKNIIEN